MQTYEILEFFLRPDNASIWAEVQGLAQKKNYAAIKEYVAEAHRLTSSLRNVRVATQATTIEGKEIQPGNLIVLLVVSPISPPKDANSNTEDPY